MQKLRFAVVATLAAVFSAACADSPMAVRSEPSAPRTMSVLQSVQLGTFEGNLSGDACTAIGMGSLTHGKVDFEATGPVESGDLSGFTYALNADGSSVTVTPTDGNAVYYVIVKGGNFYTVYTGGQESYSTSTNSKSGKPYGVSHFNVCWAPLPPAEVCEVPTEISGHGDMSWVLGTDPTINFGGRSGAAIKSNLGWTSGQTTQTYTFTTDTYITTIAAGLKAATGTGVVDVNLGDTEQVNTVHTTGGRTPKSFTSNWEVSFDSRVRNDDGSYTYTVTVTGLNIAQNISHITFMLGCW